MAFTVWADADGGTGSRQTQHEVAVQVGDDAVARIGLHDRGADDGLAVGVHHAATHFHSLLLSFRRGNGGGENDFLAAHGIVDVRPLEQFVEDGEDIAAVGIYRNNTVQVHMVVIEEEVEFGLGLNLRQDIADALLARMDA